MRLSPAKAAVRQFFYETFLPSQLPAEAIRTSNYLVLLGDSPAEEELLEKLGVPESHVYSVENDRTIYLKQAERARHGELGTSLYYGELSGFIRYHLHSNQRFQVLNLDICGSYRNHIEPAMTLVLLFARRNPKTVIATYTNVGRDRLQLSEGLKSLAICSWLAPEVTSRTIEVLFGRYRKCGMRADIAFTMVLRHLFWIRSHLEHILIGSVMTGLARRDAARKILDTFGQFWEAVRAQLEEKLTYGDLMHVTSQQPPVKALPAVLDLNIQAVTTATYGAIDIPYHSAWFCTYQRVHSMEPVAWLEQALLSLVSVPLQFADRLTATLQPIDSERLAIPPQLSLWKKVYVTPGRQLVLPERSSQFATLRSTAPIVMATPEPATLQPDQPQREEALPSQEQTAPISARRPGDITDQLSPRELVRLLANRGYKVETIERLVPNVPRRSIAAFVANATRRPT